MKKRTIRVEYEPYEEPEREWFDCLICGYRFYRLESKRDSGDAEVPVCHACVYSATANGFLRGGGLIHWGYGFGRNDFKSLRLLDKARAALYHLNLEIKNDAGIRQTT